MQLLNGYDASAFRRALQLKFSRYLNRLALWERDQLSYGDQQAHSSLETWPGAICAEGVLEIEYETPPDDKAIGYVWQVGSDPGAVLSELLRPVVIIKADDLRAHTFKPFMRLVSLMREYSLPVSLGLVMGDISLLSDAQKTYLMHLDDRLVEIWHHGYDHARSHWPTSRQDRWYEFKNRPLSYQHAHLQKGVDLARRELGLIPSTFGAPYNQVDEVTNQAVAQVPEIQVAFHLVEELPNVLVLPKAGLIEYRFRVKTLEQFKRDFDAERSLLEPITLEIHPLYWERDDWINFEILVNYLSHEMRYNFMTPFGYAKWRQDAERLRCTKVSVNQYRIDLSNFEYCHIITTLANLSTQKSVSVRVT